MSYYKEEGLQGCEKNFPYKKLPIRGVADATEFGNPEESEISKKFRVDYYAKEAAREAEGR